MARRFRTPVVASQQTLDDFIARSTEALDALSTNVFVASAQLNLVFMNRAAKVTVRAIDPEIRRVFGVSADEILGGSIHRFHRDPARVEAVLAGRTGATFPHNAEFEFGAVRLRTNVNRLDAPDGTRLGYIVDWENISDVRAAEERAEDLRVNLESAAAAVEELSASIRLIASNAADAARVGGEAVGMAEHTSRVINALEGKSTDIGAAVSAVAAVAEQTKMLALNATIESARAGENGKGFAVVASEVKQLAGESAEVTHTISRQMSEVRSDVDDMTQLVSSISTVIAQINEYQVSIASAVEEQSAVTAEIAGRVNQAVHNSINLKQR